MLYHYVGPPELRDAISPTRRRIENSSDVRAWARRYSHAPGETEIIVTFIVNERGELWIADRRSEHIACAAGAPVLSAGEMTFAIADERVEVVAASNQSTGFCPQPTTWLVVAAALNKAGLPHPADFTARFDFRRCDQCGAINLVKESWFVCAICDADLARKWNFD